MDKRSNENNQSIKYCLGAEKGNFVNLKKSTTSVFKPEGGGGVQL